MLGDVEGYVALYTADGVFNTFNGADGLRTFMKSRPGGSAPALEQQSGDHAVAGGRERRTPHHRRGDAAAMTGPATRWTLADGRELLLFALPGHTPAPVPDRRPLPDRGNQQSQLRFDRQTGQWVIIAALRQDRTYKPPPDQCPLCPGPSGLTSEIPAPDYDVAVFENRFPSLSGAGSAPFHLPPVNGDRFLSAPGHGRCEVICFSSDHTGSFSQLERCRTRDSSSTPGGTAPRI